MSAPAQQLARPDLAEVRGWLSAGQEELRGPGSVTAWRSGRGWDALWMPEELGLAVFADLATDPGRAELGPVVQEIDHHVLWLVGLGSPASSWPAPARLLPAGRYIAVPAIDADGRPFQAARWLHLPTQPERLTEPGLLAQALARHLPRPSVAPCRTAPLNVGDRRQHHTTTPVKERFAMQKNTKLDPKKLAALQAKVNRLVGTGALTAAPHTYHH
ncbi:hypothetical protein ABZW30_42415 [Kitasatospora sp. NPDC004669]|uniref:hypothetical protein n=1 Tax=Kitasatospora sp. NPDC004669 TaxID=3154555 RepID=UPI0033BE1677